MSDYGHRQTDLELQKLECRIVGEYKKARKDMDKKVADYFESFTRRDADQRALLDKGEISEQYYTRWRLAQLGRGERFVALRDQIAKRMTQANETAIAYINDTTPGIYALNRNYAAYTIEDVSGNVGFTLWDEQTVRTMIKDAPDVMPHYPRDRALKRGIDLAWGKRQITAQVTQSILVGESLKGMADRLQENIPSMNRTSAIRAARTAVTGAENAGRIDTYVAAEKIGIKLKKQWMATLDGRTRHSHAILDGVSVSNDEKFANGCRFPGDPSGPAAEIYNCRCTIIADLSEYPDHETARRRSRGFVTGQKGAVKDVTYEEWVKGKERAGRSMANGLRDSPGRIITASEQNALILEIESLGADPSVFVFNAGARTGFNDRTGKINVRGDVFPDLTATSPRDTMTTKAVLAHEYYGHYQFAPSDYRVGDWRDEMRASYIAALKAPNLSREERAHLLVDAYDRAREAGHAYDYSKRAKEIIYGY